MPAFFLDTSALAKRYVVEAGSAWVTALTEPAAGNSSWVASVTPVELLAGFYRRVRVGALTLVQAQLAETVFRNELATHFLLVDLNAVIIQDAMRLVGIHPLRAYDALQLAVALDLKTRRSGSGLESPTFVSADLNLNTAAAAERLVGGRPESLPLIILRSQIAPAAPGQSARARGGRGRRRRRRGRRPW
jgi:predicted nucleic acid-binding protein